MKAHLVLLSIGLFFGTANALKCYQCRGANSDCEKLKDVPVVACDVLEFEIDGYSKNFKPPLEYPSVKGEKYMCVHLAYDIYTYRGCMMTTKETLITQCDKLIESFGNVKEPYTCQYCESDTCNGNSKIIGHPFALLVSCLLFLKGILQQ